MFLAIDIGNTTILLGVYEKRRLLVHGRLPTRKEKKASFYGPKILEFLSSVSKGKIGRCLISSVVPRLDSIFRETLEEHLGVRPVFVDPLRAGMPIKTLNPHEVGADRIVNAVAAYELYGGPVVIVDFGTATTFDVISERGEYLGGLIVPGVEVSARAMWEKADKLYEIEITRPAKVIGQETTVSMQAGIFYGALAQMEGVIARIKRELKSEFKVVATGGLSELITQGSDLIDEINPLLVLEGLRIILERIG